MKTLPRVSIGMPVYNGAKDIRHALDSVLTQSYQYLEVHISDNASTDDTKEICRSYLAKDRRISYHRSPRNLGVMENWRRVLKLASGEYFMWAAHDDYWSTNYVETLLACLGHHPKAVLAAGRTLYVNPDGSPRNLDRDDAPAQRVGVRLADAKQLLEQHAHNWLHGVFRREQLLKLSPVFFAADPWASDMVFLLHICLNEEITGSDSAIMYKRANQVSGPKTPRQRVKWQCRFAWELFEVIQHSSLATCEKREILKTYVSYLKRLYFGRGLGSWARLWSRAAFHWSIGQP